MAASAMNVLGANNEVRESLSTRYQLLEERTRELQGKHIIGDVEWFLYARRDRRGLLIPWMGLRITTKNGLLGFCHMKANHQRYLLRSYRNIVTKTLPGMDALDRDAVRRKLKAAGVPAFAVAYVDIAQWDLQGRLENMPVHALLGTVRTKVPVYSSTTFNVGSPDDYAALAIKTRKAGYAGYKIHPNRNWPDEHDVDLEMEIYRAVRQVVSDDWPLMSDPLEVHGYPEALRVGRLLDDLGYYWYESPMPESAEHIPAYAQLSKQLRLPLIGGERTVGDHEIRLKWLRSGATDWGRIDAYYGGLTSCFLIAIECEKLGVPMDIHCGTDHCLQVFGATSQQLIPFAEDFNSTYWGERLIRGELPIANEVGVGEGPDMDYVHDYRMSWEVIDKWKEAPQLRAHPEK